MKRLRLPILLFLLASLAPTIADVSPARIFQSRMVLQQGVPLSFWGTAEPGEVIVISYGDLTLRTTTGPDGHWKTVLDPLPASALGIPLTFQGNNKITLRDVVVGEVWAASGQSNMAMSTGSMASGLGLAGSNIMASAEYPAIRFCRLQDSPSNKSLTQLTRKPSWTSCNPGTVRNFSAVAFIFARRLHLELDVPVGIIDSSSGGKPIEPFIPPAQFQEHPVLTKEKELADQGLMDELKQMEGGVYARDMSWLPGAFYHSRFQPILPFAIRGAIWYQGESNSGHGEDPRHYRHKMRALIQGWRKGWEQNDLPFYFVQLPGYREAAPGWPLMREEQRLSLASPHTGMAVTIDLDSPGIHPPNKVDVGERLALWALARDYRKNIPYSGPLYDRFQREGKSMVIHFQHADSGLMTGIKDGLQPVRETPGILPTWFEVLNDQGTWKKANAVIRGKTVTVSSPEVDRPAAVRYAYHLEAKGCNLYNRDSLPASPFCTHPELLTWPEAIQRAEESDIQAPTGKKNNLATGDTEGNTALHWAALHGNTGLVEDLIKRGAPVNATNKVGATPLLYAVGHVDSVHALLKGGADANLASRFGSTPLLAAARYPQSSTVVKVLLDHGVDAKVKGGNNADALAAAAGAGDLKSVQLLLAAGLKPGPIMGPAMMGHRKILETMLKAGADLHKNGGFAGHALNFALYGQQPEIARLLIEAGADLNLRSPIGQHETPPILWAAYNESGDASVARLMIDKGVEVNMQSALGETALDWARARNNQALEKVLLESGARAGIAAPKNKEIPHRSVPSEPHALSALIRQSVTRSMALLQHTSDVFLQSGLVKRQQCVSCHQQTFPAMAFSWARERGLPVNGISLARQVQDQMRYWSHRDKVAKTYEMIRPQPDTPVLVGYGLLGLSALGHPANSLTDAMVWYLAASQKADGSWPAADYRPPMEDGPIQGAAFALRAMQLYPLAGRENEWKQRIERARSYLSQARPISFNQQVFQLLGLGWASGDPDELQTLSQAIIQKQKPDGGWAQLNGLPSDSWATGQALVALHKVGGMAVSDPVYQSGVRFLLSTQFDDGSWYVRSRAWPFQPHFDSEFPHGKDQWISTGGTTWAIMALLLTQPTIESVKTVDWMAMDVPPRPKIDKAVATTTSSKDLPGSQNIDFARDIQPLLDRSCAACHGGDKKKGDFSIASRETLLKGGQSSEPVLVPGNSRESDLILMITDQVEDLEMPPLSKRAKYPAFSAKEVALLKNWIDAGLPWNTAPLEKPSSDTN